jgi:hypothetical protein
MSKYFINNQTGQVFGHHVDLLPTLALSLQSRPKATQGKAITELALTPYE